MKKLDNDAFDFIKERHDNGEKYEEIVSHLTAMGYTTATGLKLCKSAVSQFMVQNGHRTHNFKKRKTSVANYDPFLIASTITDLESKGKSIAQIARALNRAKLTTMRGLKFDIKGIHNFKNRQMDEPAQTAFPLETETKIIARSNPPSSIAKDILKSNLPDSTKLSLLENYL